LQPRRLSIDGRKGAADARCDVCQAGALHGAAGDRHRRCAPRPDGPCRATIDRTAGLDGRDDDRATDDDGGADDHRRGTDDHDRGAADHHHYHRRADHSRTDDVGSDRDDDPGTDDDSAGRCFDHHHRRADLDHGNDDHDRSRLHADRRR
jgi:hypothetical protein